MLQITIPDRELYDEENNLFITIKGRTLQLEHSLVSISKWEAIWNKPFLSLKKDEVTEQQMLDYIKCMTITQNVDPLVYLGLTSENIEKIKSYIESPMTATTFPNSKKGGNKRIITSELIYYWMVALNIPFECQRWHINRLITLIRVCEAENAPAKKMSKNEVLSRNRALNEARKQRLHTNG